jgi:ligand-binding sensor domain-containing protein
MINSMRTIMFIAVVCTFAPSAFAQEDMKWEMTTLPKTDIRSIASEGNKIYVGTMGEGVFRSADNGKTWEKFNEGGLHPSVYTLALKNNTLYAGTRNGVYQRMKNSQEWKKLSIPMLDAARIYSVLKTSKYLFAGSKDGVYRINKEKAELLKERDNWKSNIFVYALQANKQVIAMGTGDGLHLSENYGNDWVFQDGVPQTTVSAVELDQKTIYATTDGKGIYQFIKGQWRSINNGLPTLKVFSIVPLKDKLFCGTEQGVFISKGAGQSWSSFNNGLDINGNLIVNALKSNKNYLFSATEKGLYKMRLN